MSPDDTRVLAAQIAGLRELVLTKFDHLEELVVKREDFQKLQDCVDTLITNAEKRDQRLDLHDRALDRIKYLLVGVIVIIGVERGPALVELIRGLLS